MTDQEKIAGLEDRVAKLEATVAGLCHAVRQLDGDIMPYRRIGPGVVRQREMDEAGERAIEELKKALADNPASAD